MRFSLTDTHKWLCLHPLQMLLVDYYRTAPDLVQFNQFWCPDTTMMDKIKVR